MERIQKIERQGNFIRFQITVAGKRLWFLTHAAPHLEEIVGAELLERYGTAEFLAAHCPLGIIYVGVFGEEFDEHPANGDGRKENECAATLLAKALGVEARPELQELLTYVLRNDLKANDEKNGLATMVNMLHRQFPNEPARVINWALLAIGAKINAKERTKEFNRDYFVRLLNEQNPDKAEVAVVWLQTITEAEKLQDQAFQAAIVEIKEKAKITEIIGPNKRKLRLLVIESDNNEMGRASRFQGGGNADIVVQKRSSGQVTIHSNRKNNLKFFALARILRFEEQKAGGEVTVTNWRELSNEGMMFGWYFHHQGQFLLNGSITAPATPPTKLSLARIEELIAIAVNPDGFEPVRAPICSAGICSSRGDNRCSWHDWGLPWCQATRAKQAQRRVAKRDNNDT